MAHRLNSYYPDCWVDQSFYIVNCKCLINQLGRAKLGGIKLARVQIITGQTSRPFAVMMLCPHMGIIDEWYTVFQKIKIPHGSILPVGLISQTFELYFPAFTLAGC